MSIQFIESERIFQLNAGDSSLILRIADENYLLSLYYGKALPFGSPFRGAFDGYDFRDYAASFSPRNAHVKDGAFSPDVAPLAYSGFGTGDFRKSAVAIRNHWGNDATDFRYVSHKIYAGKPQLPGLPATYANEKEADTLELLLRDSTTAAELTLFYTAFRNEPVITQSVRLANPSESALDIEKLYSASVSLNDMDYDLWHLYGRWGAERNLERTPLRHGQQSISSSRGSSSHYHNPFVALVRHGATEDYGEVYGCNLVYSGSFDITVDCDYYETTRLLAGINPDGFTWHLDPGETFQTPEVVMVYTDGGVGEMSRIFHRLYREHLIRGRWKTEKRPLLINSWEAAYFNFDTDKLVNFAEHARDIGIEMLVMDDGWFGVRNDDTNSLGDWYVNEKKLPGGLGVLIDRVKALGLKFGIWYEPEMISPDSDLYRAHPDWCLHVPHRDNSIARSQYVIDMSRKDVQDNIYGQMAAILGKYDIDYVKWDFNRNLTEAGSALLDVEHGEEIYHRFVLGTYAVMDRLTRAFPDLLLENCSGGGGRFDAGMLYYSPQIWASDNTDPIERLAIQFGTSLCYPAATMGAHVSMCSRTGFDTKGNVAMWGTFGYELDPNRLTEEDRALFRRQVAEYHFTYDLIHEGDLYRLVSPFDNAYCCAWSFVSPDKNKVLLTHITMRYYHNRKAYIRLKGLDPAKTYRCRENGLSYSGAFLMNAGLNISNLPHGDGNSFTLYFEA